MHYLQQEGLITTDGNYLKTTNPLGRVLVRVVASVFDSYLPDDVLDKGLTVGSKI